jgi:pimeloyl-ACP methyl ester carboxylesterase
VIIKLRKVLIGVLIVIVLLYCGACTFMRVKQESMIFHPVILQKEYKFDFTKNFEEVFLNTGDAEINALHFKVPSPKGVIFYMHGNAGALDSWGEVMYDLERYGYDLFIYDYRGYGKSTGIQSEIAFHNDAKMLYEYLLRTYEEKNIIVYGRSLGTGFATKLASEHNPKLLILETPYYSFQNLSQGYFPFLPVGLILKYKIRTDLWFPKVKCPVLIFHGTEDEVIPYKQSLKLTKLFDKKKDKLVTFKGGTHSDLLSFPKMREFLAEYLR